MILDMLHTLWRDEVLSYRYGKQVFFCIVAVLCGFAGYQGYTWYFYKQNVAAQHALAEAIDEYEKANYYLLDQKNQNKPLADQYYKDAQLAFDVVKVSHSRSVLSDYAKAFEADIALREGDYASALTLLDDVISQMSTKNPLYDLMFIKRTLVALDSGDLSALATLNNVANDAQNSHFDTAAFYLGYYYFVHDQTDQAIQVWKALKDRMNAVQIKSGKSPWLPMIEEKLQQLGA